MTNVAVTCVDKLYTVGGSAIGIADNTSALLQDNGGDNLVVTGSGPFTFTTKLAKGADYAVTVLLPPVGKTCTVTNGTGKIGASNVVNVIVACH